MALHQRGAQLPVRSRIGPQHGLRGLRALPICRTRPLVTASLLTQRNVTKKDATAELLAGAIKFALQSRLRTHKGINVDVQSNAFDLMGGKFGGMTVVGTGWRTPLALTAQKITVSVGELQVDSAALLFQQRVALKNIPIGSCSLILSPGDLGNFMVHDIMKGTASKAVQGQAFAFDPSSVQYTRTASGVGQVLYEGTCAAGGKPHAYAVAMDAPVMAHTPATSAPTHSHSHHAHTHGKHHSARGSTPPPPIRVRARHVAGTSKHAHAHGHSTHSTHVSRPVTTAVQLAVEDPPIAQDSEDHTRVEEIVSNELSHMFSSLKLNLQGVELSAPRLRLLEQPGGTPEKKAPMFLEIHATLRLLDVPPLNMQF